MSEALAYFITFRTYGTWLPGDQRTSVDRRHNGFEAPKLAANVLKELANEKRLASEPVLLTGPQRDQIEKTIREVCAYRHWHPHAVNVRRNHVHAVITAPKYSPERVMNDLKANSTRRLVEAGLVEAGSRLWARHGSTPHLFDVEALEAAIDYVLNQQD